jgi:hypothetical protein
MKDSIVLRHIEKLVAEEEKLYGKGNKLKESELERLHHVKDELDQCWDFLRQRKALRNAGRNPEKAKVRPKKIIRNYVE